MHRPRGPARWAALLLLACTALVAVSVIPRGMIRTIAAVESGFEVATAAGQHSNHPDVEAAQDGGRDLPGVRGFVSRDERDAATAETLLAARTGVAPVVVPEPLPDAPAADDHDEPALRPWAPELSRGPPSSI